MPTLKLKKFNYAKFIALFLKQNYCITQKEESKKLLEILTKNAQQQKFILTGDSKIISK